MMMFFGMSCKIFFVLLRCGRMNNLIRTCAECCNASCRFWFSPRDTFYPPSCINIIIKVYYNVYNFACVCCSCGTNWNCRKWRKLSLFVTVSLKFWLPFFIVDFLFFIQF
jgi:hypothetical protein